MLITGRLTPNYATLTSSQVALVSSVTTIGDLSTYTFTITVNQPLSQNPCILIDFPTQITITTANSTLSSCTVAINTLGIGSKLCQLQGTNSILVSLTHTTSISNRTSIQIAIPNVQNPSNPTPSVSGFNITTYYTCS